MAINHDQSSTGTAYNISVLFYLPPSISYLSSTKRYYDTVRRVHENEEENVVCFEVIYTYANSILTQPLSKNAYDAYDAYALS